MDNNVLAPEAVGDRPVLPHNRYVHAGSATSLDGVKVEIGTGKRQHAVFAPKGSGEISRRLRRYGLCLSRVKFPNATRQAKTWGVDPLAIEVASRTVANEVYERAYTDDPSVGTVSVAPLARLLNEPMPPKQLLLEALSYVGTQAFHDLKSVVNDDVRQALEQGDDYVKRFTKSAYSFSRLMEINSSNKYNRRYSKRRWADYVRTLDGITDQWTKHLADSHRQSVTKGKNKRLMSEMGKGLPTTTPVDLKGWYPLFVSKPPLEVPHTGKLGRRLMYTNEGKYPRNIGRMITDPERRIFTRKTRSLGAVVVIDCSGSMSLTEQDLAVLMKSSAGATVVTYSTGDRADTEHPNCWIVARKGRQVRRLPDYPGGNGCDAPALAYGVSLRSNSSQPVIWVSDGMVTGIGDEHSKSLWNQCQRLINRHGIHHVETVREAVALMRKLQGGKS